MSSPPTPVSSVGHSLGYPLASLKLLYCGGSNHTFQKKCWVHMGGTEIIMQGPRMSPIQNLNPVPKTKRHTHEVRKGTMQIQIAWDADW